jgi:aconitate hydratase
MLCVAFALVGRIDFDFASEAIGVDDKNEEIYLKDLWPTSKEIEDIVENTLEREMFVDKYSAIYSGDKQWQQIEIKKSLNYPWQENSTYIKQSKFFSHSLQDNKKTEKITNAKILLLLGDSVTTDHISPAGNIPRNHSAGKYLTEKLVRVEDFNSFGSRRGNHEVMTRGTFANIRIKNRMFNGEEGGYTYYHEEGKQGEFCTIYDAAMRYAANKIPLVVLAGKEYGTGSSRDWAAKGTKLLGVRAVIAKSFERIHRSNLIGMGVLPLQFIDINIDELKLQGNEQISLSSFNKVKVNGTLQCNIKRDTGAEETVELLVRIDTQMELLYFLNNGILNYALEQFK